MVVLQASTLQGYATWWRELALVPRIDRMTEWPRACEGDLSVVHARSASPTPGVRMPPMDSPFIVLCRAGRH